MQVEHTSQGVYTSVEELLELRHVAKDIKLETNRKSVALMDGDSRTSFRGRGMEFAEVRPYQVGDDIRNIDWRVTARTQKPYTKLFQEERERPVYILVDQRSPMYFGSQSQFKSVFAAKLASVIAWAAMQNNDRIGALIFSDGEQTDSRALRGKHAALSIVHQLIEFNQKLTNPIPINIKNPLEDMLHDIRRVAKPGSSIFIISDFFDFNSACREPLSILARHSDVTVIHTYDQLEETLPIDKYLTISNGISRTNISGQNRSFAESFSQSFQDKRYALREACNHAGISFASSEISTPIEKFVLDLFCGRRLKRRGR